MSAALRLARPALRSTSVPIASPRVGLRPAASPLGLARARPATRLALPALGAAGAGVISPAHVSGARAFSLWPFGRGKSDKPAEEAPAAATAPAAEPATAEPLPSTASDAADASAGSAADVAVASTDAAPAAPAVSEALGEALPAVGSAVPGGEFAAAGLPNGYLTVPYCQQLMEWIAVTTNMPWWVVILGVSVAVRAALLPLTIWGQRMTTVLGNIQPKMKVLMAEYQYAKKANDQATLQKAGSRLQALLSQNGITATTAFKAMIPNFLPVPIFATIFFAVNGIAKAGLQSMTYGGLLWIPDLTQPDPYLAIPIITSAAQLVSMEMSRQIHPKDENPQQKIMKTAFRIGLVVSPLLIKNWPSGVLLVWAVNAVLGALQAWALQQPRVISYFNLPKKAVDTRPVNRSENTKGWMEKAKDKLFGYFKKDQSSVIRDRQSQEKQRTLQKRRAALERLAPSSGLAGSRTAPRRPPQAKK